MKKGLLLNKLDDNLFVPTYDNLLLDQQLYEDTIFILMRNITLIEFDNIEESLNYYPTDIDEGYIVKSENNYYIHLNDESILNVEHHQIDEHNYENLCFDKFKKGFGVIDHDFSNV